MSAADLFNPAHQEVFSLQYDEASQLAPIVTLQGSPLPGFRHTRAGKAGYKLYVVCNAAGVHYVGCTRTSFGQRLRLGYTRHRQAYNGYHGYKWLTQPSLLLYIFPLNDKILATLTSESDSPSPRQVVECIEAELVYCVRHYSGQWPLRQHEIHFHALPHHTAVRQIAIEVAQAIFQRLTLPPHTL